MTTKNENQVKCAIVVTSSANMPSNCWGRYLRVGAVVVDAAKLLAHKRCTPAMLSGRARGVVEILETWERQHSGGPKSAAQLAIKAAEDLCDKYNDKLGDEAQQALDMLAEFRCKWLDPKPTPQVFTLDNTPQEFGQQDLYHLNSELERKRRNQWIDLEDTELYSQLQTKVLEDYTARMAWRRRAK